jgi:hypothetical protein
MEMDGVPLGPVMVMGTVPAIPSCATTTEEAPMVTASVAGVVVLDDEEDEPPHPARTPARPAARNSLQRGEKIIMECSQGIHLRWVWILDSKAR